MKRSKAKERLRKLAFLCLNTLQRKRYLIRISNFKAKKSSIIIFKKNFILYVSVECVNDCSSWFLSNNHCIVNFLFPTRLTERTRNRRSRVINWYLGSIVDRELFRFVLFNFKCIEKSMYGFISLFFHLHELINIILINVNFLQLYIHIKLFQTVSKNYFTSTSNVFR